MSEVLTLVFDFKGVEPFSVLDAMTRVYARHHVPLQDLTLQTEPIEFSHLVTALKRTKRQGFLISIHGFELTLCWVKHYRLNSLSIKAQRPGRIPWDEWIFELVNENFVSAWVADAEYEFWQNAEDPLQYTALGRTWDHLPKRSNDLPPPLEQIVVDTSQNPGRRILRIGFIEAVGSLMWFGERFWEMTGAEKQCVISEPFLKCAEVIPGVIRVESAKESFLTDQGQSGDLQRRLRALLFPSSK
jgi:hypothetical protein